MASLYLGEGVMIAIQPSSILVWIVLLVVLGHKLTNGLSIAIELLNRTNGKQKCLPHSTTILFTSLPSLGCLSVIVFNCLIAWQTKMSNSISMEYSCFRMILISLSLATLLHQTILIIQQRYCFTFSLNDFYQPESKQSKNFERKIWLKINQNLDPRHRHRFDRK
ncbi:hypothetical protein SSS_06579 [Sarcoptes scabiei]|uniref:Uncharacterized protein n=1 Tax=Sarcoptes scabiei TaxID=52283 RepID=A0A834VFU7_SARSC|nr:hypothetical protein SSS_06579 [Sarcoptes scabiei]